MPNDRIKHSPLVPINDMKRLERGVGDHGSSAADKTEIVSWHDTLLSQKEATLVGCCH